jgi:Holliday junction resolvasome RuvABC endonuclease subunit
MLVHILGESDILNNISTDASDAVAAALCHAFSKNSLLSKKTGKESWEQFIRQNPDKLL